MNGDVTAATRCAPNLPRASEPARGAEPWLSNVVAALCSALILFMRSSDSFLHPIAGWEDATQGLNYYTSAGATPLHFYAGYASLLPNLFDWISVTLLPLQDVPFAQAYFALGAAACIAPALASFFRTMLGWKTAHATAVAILLTCLPWGDAAAISNTEFSIWSLLCILLLTAFNQAPTTHTGRFLFVAWRICIIFSTPLSAICLPIWCVLGWRRRHSFRRLSPYVCLGAATLVYFQFGVDHAHSTAIKSGGILGGVDAALALATEKSLVALIVRDICRINPGAIAAVPAALMLLVVALSMWKLLAERVQAGPSSRKAAFALYAILLATCLACGLGRGAANGATFVLDSPRYHYVPQLLWLAIIAILLQAIAARSRRLHTIIILLSAIATALMWQKGWKSYQSDNQKQSHEIIAFLSEAERERSAGKPPQLRYSRGGRDGDWSIVLFAPAAKPRDRGELLSPR